MSTEATRKAIYLSHFTPSMMPPEALESMHVQREPLLKTAVKSIIESVNTGARHHQLFVGPRGIGKTHLISLIHHRIAQEKTVHEKALIAWMREEEWGVTSFFDLVLRILRNLNLAYPERKIDQETEPLYELDLKDAEPKASSILAKLIKNKVLIILQENLDDLFEQLGDAGQKQWRAFIQNHPHFILVTTTPSLFSGVSAQKSVFYGFFDITQLDEFSFDEVFELLKKIAEYREDEELVNYLATPEGRARVRAVHHLAEGNPRIYIIFSQFLSKVALDELVQAFMHTLDELTPYYQARMKELSGQQRKILEFLISYRGASSVKDIAKACFLTSQICSSQLKLLKEKRYVRSEQVGRESFYELREPLMRLCMTVKTERSRPIGLLVQMLRIWYSETELRKQLEDPRIEGFEVYIKIALEHKAKEKIEPHIVAVVKDLQKTSIGIKDSAIKEFAFLETKNDEIKNLQAVLKLLLTDKDRISSSMAQEEVPRLINLIERAKTQQLKTRDFIAGISPIIGVSIKLEAKHGDLNSNLIRSILDLNELRPTEMAVSYLKGLRTNDNSDVKHWANHLMSEFEKRPYSGQGIKFYEKSARMMLAYVQYVYDSNSEKLLKLPKEERKLVESVLIETHVSNKTNEEIK